LAFLCVQFTKSSTIHPFLFGLFVLGVGLRCPSLLTELRGYRQGFGDLNRVFLNNVLQILVCVPLPWLLHHMLHGGLPVLLYSGDISVLCLSLFIMGSLVTIILRSSDWVADHSTVLPIAAIAVFFVAEAILLDYGVLLSLQPEQC
jgi:hypothetical protein